MADDEAYSKSVTLKLTETGRKTLRSLVRHFEDQGYSRVQQVVIESLVRLAGQDESIRRQIAAMLPNLISHRSSDPGSELPEVKRAKVKRKPAR
jgi:hypothetical protein